MATNLVIPSDIQSRTAGEKADFYSTQRMAGFSDPAIRNAVSGVVGPQSDDDWAYLMQLSGYAGVPPDSPQGSNPYGNSVINALRNNTQSLPAGSASSFTMLPNRTQSIATPTPAPAPIPNYLNKVTPFSQPPAAPATQQTPVRQPVTQQNTTNRNLRSMLPPNWDNLNADQKISWFNFNNATPQELKSAGVSQGDIDWMTGQGFGNRPTRTDSTRDVVSMLPNDWNTFDPNRKIDWFNQNDVTSTELRAFGVPEEDIAWMGMQGYNNVNAYSPNSGETFENPTGPVDLQTDDVALYDFVGEDTEATSPQNNNTATTPATSVTPATPVTPQAPRNIASMLPSGWGGFGANAKIDWFNANNVTPEELLAAGVPQSDIDWMMRNGYGADDYVALYDDRNLYETQER